MPLRGPARLLFSSYARTRHQPQRSAVRLTTEAGDVFDADLSSTLEWQLWAFGRYEPHFAELFRLLVRPGDRCVDVGANVGVHTIRLAKLAGQQGEVIAIEPDPQIMRRAQRNVELNGLETVRLVNAAASDQPGETQLFRPSPWDTNRARASLLHHPYLTGAATTVPVVTLDDVCAAGRVSLIKIDVEGHEAAVVRGAAATIARHRPSVIFEYAPELLGSTAQSPFAWLAERGYVMFAIHAVRHRITGRTRLALERTAQEPDGGGNMLAVPAVAAARIGSLAR
ncbi:MAG TPA: FkbM family methyltransferase [Trebonia sp.]|nr:FkbM family methyltransferase [Trebonia sp.]